MSKNIYRIIFLNEKTQFNRSVFLNNKIIYFLCFILIIILFLSVWGAYRIIKPHAQQKNFNNLLSIQRDTSELLSFLVKSNKVDSSMLLNCNLQNYFINNKAIVPSTMPSQGIVTRGLEIDKKPPHNGIDVAATFNSGVKATQEGLVLFAGELKDLGNTIIISHPNNFFSFYSHLNKIIISNRQYVKNGEKIGTIGQSGNSDGPHLHFEIWKNSHIIDPRNLFNEYKVNDVSIK